METSRGRISQWRRGQKSAIHHAKHQRSHKQRADPPSCTRRAVYILRTLCPWSQRRLCHHWARVVQTEFDGMFFRRPSKFTNSRGCADVRKCAYAKVQVTTAQVSRRGDRRQILNVIAEQPMDSDPPSGADKSDRVTATCEPALQLSDGVRFGRSVSLLTLSTAFPQANC